MSDDRSRHKKCSSYIRKSIGTSTSRGFRQGDALSCDLFNICLEIIVRKVDVRASNNNIFVKSSQFPRNKIRFLIPLHPVSSSILLLFCRCRNPKGFRVSWRSLQEVFSDAFFGILKKY
ncbi:hypothetical protein ACFFRR_005150 [Megaselia abdita]